MGQFPRSGAMAALERVCRQPEIAPLLAEGLEIGLDAHLAGPFRIENQGASVVLGPSATGGGEVPLAFALRFAAEGALWLRLCGEAPGLALRAAASLLAARSAALVHGLLGEAERAACRDLLDPDLLPLLGSGQKMPDSLTPRLAGLMRRLMAAYDGADLADDAILAKALGSPAFRQGWKVAAPAEYLLTTGGDSRLKLDPESGLNRYGCSPRPRPQAITFASTTATSISEESYAQVKTLRHELVRAALAGRLDDGYGRAMGEVRARVLAYSGAGAVPGTETVLTPSGTDAEFYALHLALAGGGDDRPITNIIIAPHETGSNVVPAASGRHYSASTALGHVVEADAPIDAATVAKVEIASVAVRDAKGGLLAEAEIDAAARRFAAEAVQSGRRVLLHLLDTSKTGLVAPSIACVLELARQYAGSLDVVVDASQMRLDQDTIAAYLGQGFMVIVTGSKFFTGPPFAGALLVPPAIAQRASGGGANLPAGYRVYTERRCWPEGWGKFCRELSDQVNLGLLLRWWAALREMEGFLAVPAPWPRRILATFTEAVRATVAEAKFLRLLPVSSPRRAPLAPDDRWDGLATIFTFALLREGSREPLDLAMAQRLYGWLNRDVSPWLPATADAWEKRLAAVCCHIGQPVSLSLVKGHEVCGLRLSAGARLVSGAATTIAATGSPDAYLDPQITEARQVIAKIGLLLRYLGDFEAIG